jgi:bifunctional aspartokinase / homoserine dehydrogenase 1
VVSAIGQGMAGHAGVSGRLFGAMGSAGINVVAIAQGASELSISVAVAEKEALRAVRAVHTAFGLTRLVHLVMVGCGRVGKELLRILEQTQTKLLEELDLQLRLVAVARSSKFIADGAGLSPGSLTPLWASAENRPTDPELLARVLEEHFTDGILVDVTATDTTELQLLALRSGLHVVTANKVPLSQNLAQYHEIMKACRKLGVRYNYETTFGAGLPVLHTLGELVNTGDELLEVRGCLSGTLGAICSWLDEGLPIREAVRRAEERGYTEPDPREDLSGRDVARKALIIARASGMELEPADVALEPMIPGLEVGLDQALQAAEGPLDERLAVAHSKGAVLRYIAEIAPGRVHVGLSEVDKLSPIGSLSGPDNIFVFRTQRYREHPLVIRGPGAGVEVTAAGVLGDVLKIATSGRRPPRS